MDGLIALPFSLFGKVNRALWAHARGEVHTKRFSEIPRVESSIACPKTELVTAKRANR